MDGRQVLDSIRDSGHLAHTPVIILTAQAEEQTRRKATAKRVTRLLIKPVEIEVSLSVIQEALE